MFEKAISPAEYYKRLSKEDRRAVKNLNEKKKIDFIPTGSWVVDMLISQSGEGGLPRGHIVEVFGNESCGKTTLGISACKRAQELGGLVVWADFERTFSEDYAKNLGLDLSQNKFIFIEPDNFEHGMGLIASSLAMKPWLVVVDSVAAMTPKAFIEGEIDDVARIGLQAQLMSRSLNYITKFIPDANTCLLFTNQLRSVIKKSMYEPGPNEETSGGKALKYYSSVRIKMRTSTIEHINVISRVTGKKEKEPLNVMVKVSIAKNKIDKPYFSGPAYIRFGEGFDNLRSIIELACNTKIIKKSKSSLRFDIGDKTIFDEQNEEQLRRVLAKDQKMVDLLIKTVKPKVDEEVKKDMESVSSDMEDVEPSPAEDLGAALQKTAETFVKKEKHGGIADLENEDTIEVLNPDENKKKKEKK
jgi:recombination protein RecA